MVLEHCYVCLKPAVLSPRSRCVRCEYERSVANEKENEELRAERDVACGANAEYCDEIANLQGTIEELRAERTAAYKIADHYRSERQKDAALIASLERRLEQIACLGNGDNHGN